MLFAVTTASHASGLKASVENSDYSSSSSSSASPSYKALFFLAFLSSASVMGVVFYNYEFVSFASSLVVMSLTSISSLICA